jgi:DNA-directed RNA polymerase specialized sigma subunit
MEDALEVMMPKEREIIKKYFVEDKTLMDISIEMNMAMDLVGGYIQSAKAQIMLWM